MILEFEPGDKVENPTNKDWGIGQIQSSINNFDALSLSCSFILGIWHTYPSAPCIETLILFMK